MSPLRWSRFLTLNFIAAGIWAVVFAGGGYMFGEALSAMLGDAAEILRAGGARHSSSSWSPIWCAARSGRAA